MTARKRKLKGDQRAIDEKRLTVKMQAKARNERARNRRKLSKEKLVSGDSPRTLNINKMVELNLLWRKEVKDFREKYGHPDPVDLDRSFVEKPFGVRYKSCDISLASNIVSLALVEEGNVLFACSGIAVKCMATSDGLTTIVTSERLATEFNKMRNRDDKMRIQVLFPRERNIQIDGSLVLYDKDIALVSCLCSSDPYAVHGMGSCSQPVGIDNVRALGRAFNSGTLMSAEGKWTPNLRDLVYSTCAITEAGLGGPLTDMHGKFILGLIIDCDDTKKNRTSILPLQLLQERLKYFEKYLPNSTNYREYTLPEDLCSIVPSGYWSTVNHLTSMGYPKPPPFVLEIGGQLCNTFEDDFGDVYGYEGLDYNLWCRGTEELVFSKLRTEVVKKLCRRVVLLTSYEGNMRFFACTGYLIKWHKKGTPVILTSASLIRSSDNENKINEKLEIDVFLPPNQHAKGTLELYHLDYNIAVISVQTHLRCIHPENIFHGEKGRKKVVAIGREVEDGVLMGTVGFVRGKPYDKPSKLDCKDLKLSTCKIKKAGIGGPLVNFIDGSYAGMNFYDGTTKTPYLPRRIIAKVLIKTDLPSQIRMNKPVNIMNASKVKNRWPVPKPYWHHPRFDVNSSGRLVEATLLVPSSDVKSSARLVEAIPVNCSKTSSVLV